MYTIEWAREFNGFEKNEQFDLQKFVVFYEEYITNRVYSYKTDNKRIPSFMIDSRPDQLPHLLGLQKWNNLSVQQASKQYEQLSNGKWDMSFLAKADKGTYKEYKSRIESMPYLYRMLHECKCEIMHIHPVIDSPFKRRNIQMIFEEKSLKLFHVLELRQKNILNDDRRIYVPASFTVYRKNSKALVGKHTKLNIKSISYSNNSKEVVLSH
ncbi:PBECR4 domain-containing protein [Gracilibacillus sp. Marseille-QA3620]